ncbi:hypothetical protein KCTC52924_00705 [Arenibacter antarcticus]
MPSKAMFTIEYSIDRYKTGMHGYCKVSVFGIFSINVGFKCSELTFCVRDH